MRSPIAIVCVGLLLAIASCVTEVQHPPGRGSPFRTQDTSRLKSDSSSAQRGQQASASIEQSTSADTSSARVQVSILPLGSVVYDAQTLPLVSPDGRYLVAQQGVAPDWDAMLATDDAAPVLRTRQVVHEITSRGLAPLPTLDEPEPGTLLGRDADRGGFLLESIRADGSRWIGKRSWTDDTVSWLTQGLFVHAHGVLLRDGSLVCARRKPGEWRAEVVLRPGAHDESVATLDNATLLYPTPSPDSSIIFAVAATADATLDLVAFAVEASENTPPRLGAIVSRRTLGRFDDPAMSYQVFAPLQPSAWAHHGAGFARKGVIIANPASARAAWFDASMGRMSTLPENAVAGAAWSDSGREGFLCTLPDEVAYIGVPSPASASPRPVRVLAGPWVARVVDDGTRTDTILLGPDRERSDRIAVVRMRLGMERE